jgi:hypothetical protein
MTVRHRRRYKPIPLPDLYDPKAVPPDREVETITEVLCACPCGHRWFAEVGTETTCAGNVARFRCPLRAKPFLVVAP